MKTSACIAAAQILALASCATTPDLSQPIATDRPGFLFNPLLVPRGAWQVEAGVPNVAYDERGGASATAVSESALVRYGVARDLELRLQLPSWISVETSSGSDSQGFGDLEAGVKVHLTDADGGWVPQSALVGSVRLPSGSSAFTGDDVGFSINTVGGWTLSPQLALTGLAGYSLIPVSNADEIDSGALALMLTTPLTDRWSGYVETAWFPSIDNGPDPVYAGLGTTYLFTPNVQLDISLDGGLNDDATDLTGAAGISFRW